MSKEEIQSDSQLHRLHFTGAGSHQRGDVQGRYWCERRGSSQILSFTDCTSRLQVRTNEEMSRAGSVPNNLGSEAQHHGKQSLSFTVTTGESLQRLLAERRGSASAAVDDFAAGMHSPCQVTHPSPFTAGKQLPCRTTLVP